MKLHHSREPRLPREVHSEAQVKVAEIGVKLNQILRQWQKGGGMREHLSLGPRSQLSGQQKELSSNLEELVVDEACERLTKDEEQIRFGEKRKTHLN